jgi:outer membrane protein TolC
MIADANNDFAGHARRRLLVAAGSLLAGLLVTGCRGFSTTGERQARTQARTLASAYRPDGQRPALPTLTTNSGLGEFLRLAMLNQPRVEAAYYDWVASVERITRERSLPDPRLTFEMDIAAMVQALMPGLMLDFAGPGKLRARAAVATAESAGRYYAFESAVLHTALAFKKAYYQQYFLTEKIRVTRQTLDLTADLERIARQQNEVGKVTMQDVLRAQIEQDRLRTELANLEDSRSPLLAQLKAALGLRPEQPAPPLPAQFETTPLAVSLDRLLEAAFARNPRLKAMEADVRRAEAALRLAARSRVPDFSAALEADANQSPPMFRPLLSVTLPVWRDKIAAEIAEAQALKGAAAARLSAEQIALAVEFAEKSFLFREATRNLELLGDALLPKARLSLEVARAGYLAGRTDFFNLIDAWRTLLTFQVAEVEARTQRELALAELSLFILGSPPPDAPVLLDGPTIAAQPEKPTPRKTYAK